MTIWANREPDSCGPLRCWIYFLRRKTKGTAVLPSRAFFRCSPKHRRRNSPFLFGLPEIDDDFSSGCEITWLNSRLIEPPRQHRCPCGVIEFLFAAALHD